MGGGVSQRTARARTGAWIGLIGIGLTACSLFRSTPLGPAYPSAESQPVDLYAEPSPVAASELRSGEEAIREALRDDALVRHLQRFDARYSGRRRASLSWIASARFRSEPPTTGDEGPQDEPSSESTPDAEGIATAIEQDGGYWSVEISTNVRETGIFYTCERALSFRGQAATPFRPRAACNWQGR